MLVKAAPIEAVYAKHKYYPFSTGAFMIMKGQEDLQAPSTSFGINKEMWLILSDAAATEEDSCWIEVGQKKGQMLKDLTGVVSVEPDDYGSLLSGATTYHSGHFVGYAYANPLNAYNREFHAMPIGTLNPTGEHTYQINPAFTSSSSWKVLINGKVVLDIPAMTCYDRSVGIYEAKKASFLQVGLEIKDSQASFTNGTSIRQMKVLDAATNQWKMVPQMSNADTGISGGLPYTPKSTFTMTSTENRLTFTR